MPNRFNKQIHITNEILGIIASIDEIKGLWSGSVSMDPYILKRLQRSVIITSSASSTRIEGAQMTDEEVARLLRGMNTNPPKSRDEAENAGYADLLGSVFDAHTTMQISENLILQFHDMLLHYSEKDKGHRGTYKATDNAVVARDNEGREKVLFTPTPAHLVQKEMHEIIDWTADALKEKTFHPLIVISVFIFEFLAIHPFHDGNGRLSRVLTNLLLLQSGYKYTSYASLEERIEERLSDYYSALRETQKHHKTKNEDITPFLMFSLHVFKEQAQEAQKLISNQEPEKLLSPRQQEVYALFVDSAETLSVKDIDERLKGTIPQATIKQALGKLVEMKLIERLGRGRAVRYKKI